MLADPAAALTIFVLSMFVGFFVIAKVPPLLHTPLGPTALMPSQGNASRQAPHV